MSPANLKHRPCDRAKLCTSEALFQGLLPSHRSVGPSWGSWENCLKHHCTLIAGTVTCVPTVPATGQALRAGVGEQDPASWRGPGGLDPEWSGQPPSALPDLETTGPPVQLLQDRPSGYDVSSFLEKGQFEQDILRQQPLVTPKWPRIVWKGVVNFKKQE